MMTVSRFFALLFLCLFVFLGCARPLFSQEQQNEKEEMNSFPYSAYAPFYTCPTIGVAIKVLFSSTCKKAREEFWANLPTLFEKYYRNPSLLFAIGPGMNKGNKSPIYQDDEIIKLLINHYKKNGNLPLLAMDTIHLGLFEKYTYLFTNLEELTLKMSGCSVDKTYRMLDYFLTVKNLTCIRLEDLPFSDCFLKLFFEPKYASLSG